MSEDTILDQFGERLVKKFELKEYNQIVKEIEKLLLEHPKSEFGWSILGNSYYALGNFLKAIESFEQEIKKGNKDNHLPYYNLGRSYEQLKDNEKAEENYKKSLTIKPNDYSVNYSLANVYIKLSLYKEGERLLKKTYDLNSQDPEIIVNLLSTLHFNQKFEEAVKIGETAEKIHKNSYQLFYNLSLCYYELKEYQKGLEASNKSLNLVPDNSSDLADLLVAKGAHQVKLRRNDEAIETLMGALKIDNDKNGAFQNLSECFNHIPNHRASVFFDRLANGVVEFEENKNGLNMSIIRIEKVGIKQ